jgi:hypothetical protein
MTGVVEPASVVSDAASVVDDRSPLWAVDVVSSSPHPAASRPATAKPAMTTFRADGFMERACTGPPDSRLTPGRSGDAA